MKKLNLLLFLLVIFACSDDEEDKEQTGTSSSSLQESNYIDSLEYQEKFYKIAKIGSQIWFAENLNAVPSSGEAWCYGAYCDEYGKLYNWTAAKNVCPAGWKLPSKADYENLRDYVESEGHIVGYALKSAKGWGPSGGSDAYKFSAIPGGSRDINISGYFVHAGKQAFWWTSSESGGSHAHYCRIEQTHDFSLLTDEIAQGFSVRCIKG